jgi:hypothetical protein
MARRRSQHPTPFKEGNYWWLRVWDTSPTGSRKLQRIKLAKADMAVREVEKIVDEKLRPMNEGTELRGSAMRFGDFMDQVYIPRYLREAETGRPAKLASTTRASYKYMISKYLRPASAAGVSAISPRRRWKTISQRSMCPTRFSRRSEIRCLRFFAQLLRPAISAGTRSKGSNCPKIGGAGARNKPSHPSSSPILCNSFWNPMRR